MRERLDKILAVFEREALWVSLRAVCDHPQQELRVETPFVDVGEAKSLDASLLGLSALEPGSLAHTDRMRHFYYAGRKWRFLKVYDRRIVRNERTPANIFVSYFVRYSIKLLREIAYSLSDSDEDLGYFEDFMRIVRRLNGIWEALSPSFKYAVLYAVPIDNQLLQFDPGYHVILESWLACEAL